jgi:riboflavin transporter FmnP
MRKMTTVFFVPLVVGMTVAVFGFNSITHEGFTVWKWCLAVLAVVVIGALLGALLNFAVFAPVYWLLGRVHSKTSRTGNSHEQKGNCPAVGNAELALWFAISHHCLGVPQPRF